MSLNPEYAQTARKGDLEAALAADFGSVEWELGTDRKGAWPTSTSGDDTKVYLQFLSKEGVTGTTTIPVAPTESDPPNFRWLVDNNSAARLIAQNSEGAWACALVIWRPSLPTDAIVVTNFLGTSLPLTKDNVGKTKAEAWMSGIWYDANETADTSDEERESRCSPVLKGGSTHLPSLPTSPSTWPVGNPTAAAISNVSDGVVSAWTANQVWSTLKPAIE